MATNPTTALSGPVSDPTGPAVATPPKPRKRRRLPKLGPVEMAFVRAKLTGLNNSKALRRAIEECGAEQPASDGALRDMAYRVAGRPKVKRALEMLERDALDDLRVNAVRIKAELAAVGFSSIDHYQIDDDGQVALTEEAPPWAMRAVSSIKRKVRMVEREDAPPEKHVETEIRLWDKNAALKSMGDSLSMFRDDKGGSGVVLIFDLGGRAA